MTCMKVAPYSQCEAAPKAKAAPGLRRARMLLIGAVNKLTHHQRVHQQVVVAEALEFGTLG